MRFSLFYSFVSFSSLVLGSPLGLGCGENTLSGYGGSLEAIQKVQAGGSQIDPCAMIGQLYNKQIQANSNTTQTFYSPTLMLQCLRTVPMIPDVALNFTQYVKNFLQFQSTLAYLKNPPSTYPNPAVDLLGGMDTISANITSGYYTNWWDFEVAIVRLFLSAYDGHLSIKPPLLPNFLYFTSAELISFSTDGSEKPGVYSRHDLLIYNGKFQPSEIVTINGEDVNDVLLSMGAFNQDPDALYNSMFWNPAIATVNTHGSFLETYFLRDDESFTYAFSNGTTRQVQNLIATRLHLGKLSSGQDLHDALVAVQPQSTQESKRSPAVASSASTSAVPSPTATSAVPPAVLLANEMTSLGYPKPIAISADNTIAGYFLPNVSDTAVLSIRQFTNLEEAPVGVNWYWEFQNTIQVFLAESAKQGKKRLIIDIRGNPGGAVNTGMDAFKQIFPGKEIITKNRMRIHPAANAMGEIFSQVSEVTNAQYNLLETNPKINLTVLEALAAGRVSFNAQDYLVSPDGAHVTSWSQFQPVTDHGDTFSNFFSFDLASSPLDLLADGIIVSGYGNRTNLPPQVFDASNIVLLSDGNCASTCTIFSNLMLTWGKVHSIAIGGRPSDNKMAVIGGVAGSQTWKFSNLQQQARWAFDLVPYVSWPSDDATSAAVAALSPLLEDPPVNFKLSNGGVNFLNNFAGGDVTSNVPLQFQPAQTADCRMFNTIDDIVSVQYTWERIATGGYVCVDGGNKW